MRYIWKISNTKTLQHLCVKDRQYGQYTVLQDVSRDATTLVFTLFADILECTFGQTSSQLHGNSCHYTKNIYNFYMLLLMTVNGTK